MNFSQWTKSNADYGRKLLNSGFEGARSGEEEFLSGKPIAPFLSESARHSVTAAVLGASIGLLGGLSTTRHKSTIKAVACGLVGAALGFGASVAWEGRSLGASVIAGALKNIGKVRDEHWLEKNPIDYA